MHFLAVANRRGATRVEHFDVFEWIAIDDDEIGEPARTNASELVFLPQDARVVAGAVLDDLERIEPCLLVQFHLADEAVAVHLVDKSRIVATADRAAHALEVPERAHPDTIVLFPVHFVGGAPSDEVRSVIRRIRLEVVGERRMQIVTKPWLRLRTLEVAACLVDVERRHPGDAGADHRHQHGIQQFRIRLAPEAPGPTEAIRLVQIVVVAREMLAEIRNGSVGDAVPVLD